jgi:hypothetical protein
MLRVSNFTCGCRLEAHPCRSAAQARPPVIDCLAAHAPGRPLVQSDLRRHALTCQPLPPLQHSSHERAALPHRCAPLRHTSQMELRGGTDLPSPRDRHNRNLECADPPPRGPSRHPEVCRSVLHGAPRTTAVRLRGKAAIVQDGFEQDSSVDLRMTSAAAVAARTFSAR